MLLPEQITIFKYSMIYTLINLRLTYSQSMEIKMRIPLQIIFEVTDRMIKDYFADSDSQQLHESLAERNLQRPLNSLNSPSPQLISHQPTPLQDLNTFQSFSRAYHLNKELVTQYIESKKVHIEEKRLTLHQRKLIMVESLFRQQEISPKTKSSLMQGLLSQATTTSAIHKTKRQRGKIPALVKEIAIKMIKEGDKIGNIAKSTTISRSTLQMLKKKLTN